MSSVVVLIINQHGIAIFKGEGHAPVAIDPYCPMILEAAGERVQLRPGDQVKLSQQLILEIQRPGAEHKAPEAAPAPKIEAGPAKPVEAKPVAAEPAKPVDKKKTVFDPGNR